MTTTHDRIYPTGLRALDKALGGGGRQGDMVIVFGAAKTGKTMMSEMILSAHLAQAERVTLFSHDIRIQEYMKIALETHARRLLVGDYERRSFHLELCDFWGGPNKWSGHKSDIAIVDGMLENKGEKDYYRTHDAWVHWVVKKDPLVVSYFFLPADRLEDVQMEVRERADVLIELDPGPEGERRDHDGPWLRFHKARRGSIPKKARLVRDPGTGAFTAISMPG